VAFLVVVGVSYGLVWTVTTKLLHRNEPSIRPGETGWYAPFQRLWLRNADGQTSVLPDAFIIVSGSEIYAVSGRYTPVATGGESVSG
jgi:hypothetical protein